MMSRATPVAMSSGSTGEAYRFSGRDHLLTAVQPGGQAGVQRRFVAGEAQPPVGFTSIAAWERRTVQIEQC